MSTGRIFAALSFSLLTLFAGVLHANESKVYSYVANTAPPDAFLALKLYPTANSPRIMAMTNGTKLEILLRRTDGWWYVRVYPTREEGWAFSGVRNKAYILCCTAAEGSAVAEADPEPAKSFDDFTCNQLWFGRNSIFKEAGYCFKTPRAISTFGNAGCQFDDIRSVQLTRENEMLVQAVQAAEAKKACPR